MLNRGRGKFRNMIKYTLMAVILFLSTASISNTEEVLTINVTNIENSNGSIVIAIFNNEKEGFKPENVYKHKIIDAVKGSVKAEFKLPKGEYAVSVFHDENNNKKLDTNFMRMPKEAYGFSNNLRMPKYEKAAFKLDKDKAIDIKIEKLL